MSEGYSPKDGGGLQKTDMYCHNCSGNFVAELDFDVDGNHEIHCPRCGHIHYRKIEKGKITSERYSSDSSTTQVRSNSVWAVGAVKKQDSGVISNSKVSVVSHFIRDSWLNRSDSQ